MDEVKGIVFDLGDVVLKHVPDEELAWFTTELVNRSTLAPKAIQEGTATLTDEFANGRIDTTTFVHKIVDITGLTHDEVRKLYRESCRRADIPDKEVLEVIVRLKANGLKAAYFTNMDEAELSWVKTILNGIFDTGVVSNELGESKLASGKGVDLLLQRMGLKAKEIILADDSEKNVRAAQMLGIRTIQFKNLGQFKMELERFGVKMGTPQKLRTSS